MMVEYACKLTYRKSSIYLLWLVEFIITFFGLRLLHECFHGLYAVLTGGQFGQISIMKWVLFLPILQISCSGGNTFLVIEGTLLSTWIVALMIVAATSYPFLRNVMNECTAMNLSGKLWGVRLAAIEEMIGQGVYALPNFVFIQDIVNGKVVGGDGTVMAKWFAEHGYSYQIQTFIAFLMILGGVMILIWSLRCDPEFCSKCYI